MEESKGGREGRREGREREIDEGGGERRREGGRARKRKKRKRMSEG